MQSSVRLTELSDFGKAQGIIKLSKSKKTSV